MNDQLMFSFGRETPPEVVRPPANQTSRRMRALMQRAVLGWLAGGELPPAGMALAVPTRISRLKAHIAAFWSRPVRNHGPGPRNLLQPERTAIVQCYTDRQECWVDCTRSAEILPVLDDNRRALAEVEAVIRRDEPELRDPNTLFEEYAEWQYDKTRNEEYHRLFREVRRLEHALLEGTEFEQIRAAEAADLLYLAVPAELVRSEELADGWGLLWINPNMSVSVQREARYRGCHLRNRLHLIQNIAAAATHAVLFAEGIRRQQADGSVYTTQPPRGHRKKKVFRLA